MISKNRRPIAKAGKPSQDSAIVIDGSCVELDAGDANVLIAGDGQDESDLGLAPATVIRCGMARELYTKRRKIDQIFGIPGFVVSPAWDIMLDLFQAYAQRKSLSVSSACLGAGCPSSTALRYLRVLENNGLVERVGDPNDRRRDFVAFTGKGRKRMEMALDLHLDLRLERPEF